MWSKMDTMIVYLWPTCFPNKARFTHSRFECNAAAIRGGDQSQPRIGSNRGQVATESHMNRKCEPGLW